MTHTAKEQPITLHELRQFTGTEHYYKHWTQSLVYTDGVKYLAEKAGAYWLIDLIASYRRKEPFQVWRLEYKEEKNQWLATMQTDSHGTVLVKQWIEYSDFPFKDFKLWLIDGVLMLPDEY